LAAILLLAAVLRGCVTYEYEHEFWIRVDGSGTVYVSGRPALWAAFKGLPPTEAADEKTILERARGLFEASGLRVRRATLTRRGGQSYLFVSADFADVNKLSATPAFPDLRIALRRGPEQLRIEGQWVAPSDTRGVGQDERDGVMAVRFHLPSKIYSHDNAFAGVERGNIVSWRQDVAQALAGRSLAFGASLDSRSILWSTVSLFACAILGALLILAGTLYLVLRRGKRLKAGSPGAPSSS
jgi:hypothetical protein